jgi:hypothetical protein
LGETGRRNEEGPYWRRGSYIWVFMTGESYEIESIVEE